MSIKEDIDYQHFLDKTGSIIELVQVHLLECPIVKDEVEVLQKILASFMKLKITSQQFLNLKRVLLEMEYGHSHQMKTKGKTKLKLSVTSS